MAKSGPQSAVVGPDDGLYDVMAGVKTSPRCGWDIGSGGGEPKEGRGIQRALDSGIKEKREGVPSC
jgi:hypothetical protein